MIVSANNGSSVNMREKPNPQGKIICTVPIGTKVDILSQPSTDWAQIKYKDKIGYMMTQFLKENTSITQADLQRIYDSLKDALKTIETILK